ncbi:MAG: twin-arginine translocation signal domain-containing protein [Acidobacteriaceae bacterium]
MLYVSYSRRHFLAGLGTAAVAATWTNSRTCLLPHPRQRQERRPRERLAAAFSF